MLLTTSLVSPALALAMQVGPNPQVIPPSDGHAELRDRPQRADMPSDMESEAQTNPISEWMSDCLDVLEQDAARAHTMAQIRRNETSGPARVIANHCLGLAATELQLWEDARTAFLASRAEIEAEEPAMRARAGTLAGIAAMATGDNTGALAILEQAGRDAVDGNAASMEAHARIASARALVALDRPDDALMALDRAQVLQPEWSEPHLLYATLLRRMERLDDAQSAIERAGALDPKDPQVGLEAGVIAVLSGREDAARRSWESVVALDPQGPLADTARDYLSQLGPAEPTQEPQQEP